MPLPKEFWIRLPQRREEELYEMFSNPDDYLAEALDAARDELRRRNLPICRSSPSKTGKASTTPVKIYQYPPDDWRDIEGWDRYFEFEDREAPLPLPLPTFFGYQGWQPVRFLRRVMDQGGRVWFPGCGIDPLPRFLAFLGCRVVASDFSPAAIRVQQRFASLIPEAMFQGWPAFAAAKGPFERVGSFVTAQQDFTLGKPDGEYDVVINSRAFQGLSPESMGAAARHFFAALRPGGSAVLDTMKVQVSRREVIEDALTSAGFFLPFSNANRWYRDQLRSTGIPYVLILDRPHVVDMSRYPADRCTEFAQRDQASLASFRAEYEARLKDEALSVQAVLEKQHVKVALVEYNSGSTCQTDGEIILERFISYLRHLQGCCLDARSVGSSHSSCFF